MSADIKEKSIIPEEITRTLDPRYTTDYNSDSRWHFKLNTLDPNLLSVLSDLPKLFKSAQRWEPEALRLSRGISHGTTRYGYGAEVTSFITMDVALHTDQPTPTFETGHLWWRKLFLNLHEVINDKQIPSASLSNDPSEWRRSLYLHAIPEVEPFKRYPEEPADTPYYIAGMRLWPFLLYRYRDPESGKVIAGEDISRMILDITLKDGRKTLQAKISHKLTAHQNELSQIEAELARLRRRQQELAKLTPDQLVAEERELLAVLNSRSDPFSYLES